MFASTRTSSRIASREFLGFPPACRKVPVDETGGDERGTEGDKDGGRCGSPHSLLSRHLSLPGALRRGRNDACPQYARRDLPSPGDADHIEPPSGRTHRKGVLGCRTADARSDPRREHRTHRGDRPIRPRSRLPHLDVCLLVDPAGDAFCDHPVLTHDPYPRLHVPRRLQQLRSLSEDGRFDDKEITQLLGMSVDRLRQIEQQVSDIVSLDQPMHTETDETMEDRIADRSSDAEHEALRLLFQEELKRTLDKLPARQALAIRLHYGIEDGCPYSFADAARIMGVSRERVRQLVKQGMSHISESWGHDALDYYRGLLNLP